MGADRSSSHVLELSEAEFKQVMVGREERQHRDRMLLGGAQTTIERALSDAIDDVPRNLAEEFTLENIDHAMNYVPWGFDQQKAGTIVREALTLAAKAILREVPTGEFRRRAVRDIINARMNANAGISFRGRF